MYASHLRVPNVVLAGAVVGQAVSSGIIQKVDQRPSDRIFTDLVGGIHLLFARKQIIHGPETALIQVLLTSHNSHYVAVQSLSSQSATTSPPTCA